jgi:DNA-directed RNA polymerase I and III subunit RPAC1
VFLDQATASYRLMPDITLLQPVTGDLATQLVDMCPMKVFDIEDLAIGTLRMFIVRLCCEGSPSCASDV